MKTAAQFMQKALEEKLAELCRQQSMAQRAATWALKSGDINSAVQHQERALSLAAEISSTRVALFKAKTAEEEIPVATVVLPSRLNGHAVAVDAS